jgi:hypothetical protein
MVFLPWLAAARQIVFSRKQADRTQLKSGVGIPEMNQNADPRAGY